ncbi:uncharacterized protein FSUBG_3418 [Fusarium subglutinans]|uniref:Uncharacterized protein n=1 Tax=Gibberella subglutinans TaxID=42677 RepID=A0A8H5V4D5_GIBSU|nr:uncharacterized protein FSUBG_3418 [Fusarium subglutinans]KAF5610186.1 hypothetical protein FSUBG_3418 [Fusarium subglutinans]
MASPKQDLEINMPTAQIRNPRSEMKKEASLKFHEANIEWLNKEWQGPDWFPAHLLKPSKPCRSVVRGLKSITEKAMAKKIPLSSLWETGGCLRSVVDQDLATRKEGRNAKHKHSQSGRLTRKMVSRASKNLGLPTAEIGNDCSSSSGKLHPPDWLRPPGLSSRDPRTCRASADGNPGSTTGDDSEVEAPEKRNTAPRLSSSALDSSAKQRLPSPLHDTIASTEDELRHPPQGTKRPLEDGEETTSNSPQNKSPRVTINEVLGNLSSDRIEIARRITDIELDTALAVKRDAEQALMDLVHRDCSVAVTQAERVQARRRKQEADEAFRQTHERLHGPSQTLAAMSDLKKTFDARAVRALKLENAEKVVQTCKDRLDQAQVKHEEALKSNQIDDWHLEVVWDMFQRADTLGKEVQ